MQLLPMNCNSLYYCLLTQTEARMLIQDIPWQHGRVSGGPSNFKELTGSLPPTNYGQVKWVFNDGITTYKRNRKKLHSNTRGGNVLSQFGQLSILTVDHVCNWRESVETAEERKKIFAPTPLSVLGNPSFLSGWTWPNVGKRQCPLKNDRLWSSCVRQSERTITHRSLLPAK